MEGYYLMPHPAMLIPAIGKGEELKLYKVALACYEIAEEIKKLAPETIIFISSKAQTSHDLMISSGDFWSGDLKTFECSEVRFEIELDTRLTEEIKNRLSSSLNISVKEESEMNVSTFIPLYFINQVYLDYKCIHIDCPHLSDELLYRLGMMLEDAVQTLGRKAVIIFSTNLADELENDKGESLNNQLLHGLTAKNPLSIFEMDWPIENPLLQRVLNGVKVLLGTLDGKKVEGDLLAYQTFYEVGYAVLNFKVKGPGVKSLKYIKENVTFLSSILPCKTNIYIEIARKCIEDYFKETKTMIDMHDLPEIMIAHQHGVYITLQKADKIYGVSGHIFPTKDCVATEIMYYTIDVIKQALSRGISEVDIKEASIIVDLVLSSTPATILELDTTRFGIIVTKGNRHSVVLPNSEGIQSVAEQINQACQELGLEASDTFTLEKFEVIRYQE